MRKDSTPGTSVYIPTEWPLCSSVDLFSDSTVDSMDRVRLIKCARLTKVVCRIPGYIVLLVRQTRRRRSQRGI